MNAAGSGQTHVTFKEAGSEFVSADGSDNYHHAIHARCGERMLTGRRGDGIEASRDFSRIAKTATGPYIERTERQET